jgi:RimJ/RimL family protein N-acetyltransferase
LTVVITGPRVRLRRFTDGDVPAMLRLVADPSFRSAVDEMGDDEEGVQTYLAETAGYADFEQGKVFNLAIGLHDGTVIGLVTLVHRFAKQGEVGYALHGDYQGLGYASEAAGLLVDHVFETLGFHRVYIWTRAGNAASAAVARRLGFRLEGTLVEAADMDEPRDDLLHFGLLRREWEERRGGPATGA